MKNQLQKSISIAVLFTIGGLCNSANAQNWSAVSTGFGTGPSASVDALATYNNVLLAGGRYSAIRQWDGTTWSDFATGSPSSTALFIDGNTIYSGSQATGGNNAIMKYDGTTWAPFGDENAYDSLGWNTNDRYTAIFKYNNDLFFTWNRVVMWFDPAIQQFHQVGNSMHDIGQYTTYARYAGALDNKAFFSAGQDHPNTIFWNGAQWDSLTYPDYSIAYPLEATVFNNELYVTGYFEKNAVGYSIIKYDGTNYSELVNYPPGFKCFRTTDYVMVGGGTFGGDYVGIVNGNNVIQLGDSSGTTFNAIAVYNDEVYVGGFFTTFAGVAVNNIAKIQIPSSITSAPYLSDSKLKVYPNPSKDNIKFEISGDHLNKNLKLMLINVIGEKVKEVFVNSPSTTIQVDGLKPGIYFYQLNDETKCLNTGKIIIE